MKIVVYFNSLSPAGGIERVISKHIKFLSKQHQVILITKDSNKSFYPIPFEVRHEFLNIDIKLDMRYQLKRILQITTFFLETIIKLRKKINFHKPDIVYTASPLCLLEVFLTGFKMNNIIVTEHSSFRSYNSIYKLIARKLYKNVGLLTVPTKDDSQLYLQEEIKNSYLPNPLSFFPSSPSTLNEKVVLNVGRFTDDKQHELLINLWSLSKVKNDGWKLHIIGKGENLEKMKTLIAELKLEESICILPPTKDIVSEYLSSSIFVLSSRAEGFGLVLAEAMASGVPCVAFNCPTGPKDIINDGKNGYLIDEGNHIDFVQKLDKLMKNEDLRMEFGKRSRIDIKRFNEIIIEKKLINLLELNFKKSK